MNAIVIIRAENGTNAAEVRAMLNDLTKHPGSGIEIIAVAAAEPAQPMLTVDEFLAMSDDEIHQRVEGGK